MAEDEGSFFEGGVIQKLLDQVHMGQQHSPAAVSLQTQRIEGVSFCELCLQQSYDQFISLFFNKLLTSV